MKQTSALEDSDKLQNLAIYKDESRNAVKYSSEQLDNTKGLSNSSVNYIFQDSENLLWIGTWDGLNRYDGSSFKIFRPKPEGENSLSNQVILKVGEDRSGKIWVLTMHGINCYNKKTDTFSNFYFSRKNKPPLSESEFNMALDASKQVYCSVKEWGVGYFDGKVFKKIESKIVDDKTVKKMEFTADGALLLLFENGEFYSITIKTSKSGVKTCSKSELISDKVRTFDMLSNQQICVISVSGEASVISATNLKQKEIVQENVKTIVGHTPQGLVMIGNSGYSVIDKNGNSIVPSWLKYLKNQKISTLIQGSENVIWTGSDGDGMFRIFPLKNSFNLVSKSNLPELDGGIVRSFLKDEDMFWVGTKGKGLFKLDGDFFKNPDQSLNFQNFNESNSKIDNAVFALCSGFNDLIYIGTDGAGLTIYDKKSAKIISWSEIRGSENCKFFKSVYTIYEDKKGFLWLGTNGYGIIKCQIERQNGSLELKNVKTYTAGKSGVNSLSSNIVFSIVPRNDNQLWIGTRLGGLNSFDKDSEDFLTYKNVAGNSESLSNDDILCMASGEKDQLWIGTSFGLNQLTSINKDGTAIFKSYTVKNGLPNNTIHGIVVDEKSNLWISTNFGLSNFTTQNLKFTNYSKNEGLQNNEFADGAFYGDAISGTIFMGGIKGFNYFLPQKIKESAVIPDLLIDKISGQNQTLPYIQGLVISPESKTFPKIVLNHNQNFFDIELAALTYINSEKCEYSYQLRGFDKSWNVIDNRRIISFTNVPRGDYSLWLKWSNNDGVWSKPVHAIDIKIKPVFWQSDIAVIVYIILFVFFALFVRSYYLKRQSLLQNIMVRRKEEEIHENRLTFFTNVAHEFLTPLTLIVGPVQKLSEGNNFNEKHQKFINMIQRNSSRLLFLTQQLLEFRKAEYDYLDVSVKKFDLVNLTEQIAELFDDWALDKNIGYNLEVPATLNGWFDKDKIEKILFNLMSNAFKYTPHDGKINLKCSIEGKNPKQLNITISNTGKGISKEKLDSLFDRFFLSDSNQTSDTEMFRTGIGLAYIKKLVTVLRGEIIVSSVANDKTIFTILIPCDKSAFADKEIDLGSVPVLISRHLKNLVEETSEKTEDFPFKISAVDSVENARKKILIVEDEKEIHLFLNDLLSEKYKLLSAYNGVEALEMTENELPDLIISDVMMPLMDGVELCRKIKTDHRTCHIPFIMLTAKESVVHRIEGLESGANSYIPKPFYPEHLLVRIQKLLEEKELILKHFTQDTLVENLSSLTVDNADKNFIKSVIDLIRQNIDNESLQSSFIEKNLGISTSQLYRKTKEIFGLSPGDLIRTIRLKHSAELLRKNILTVSEISYKSGFNNRSYFYREFKKMYNTTPKNYHLQYKAKSITFSNN